MKKQITLKTIIGKLEMVSEGMEFYLNTQTGETAFISEENEMYAEYDAEEMNDLADSEIEEAKMVKAIIESDDYVKLPSKYEIHDYSIMQNFGESIENEHASYQILNSIKGSGAFRKFRSTIDRLNLTKHWYVFKENAYYEIAAEWCEDNDIPYIDDRPKKKSNNRFNSMEKIIKDWQQNAERKQDRNFKFLTSLKMKSANRVDAVAQELHQEAFEKIDCLECGNCCKNLQPEVTKEDIDRISNFLELSKEAFIDKYLNKDEDGELQISQAPCHFLGSDNKCSIYEVRPETCQTYPHTQKDNFSSRRYFHSGNLTVCPAAYYIVERMKANF